MKVICLNKVTMSFRVTTEKIDNLKEYFVKILKREIRYKEFDALKNISFDIEEGERVGIIGHNGAGKSTLLKLISGVMKPTYGDIKINGSIAPLLELGAGFDYEMTGSNNIFLNGAMLGKDKTFLKEHYNEIVEYAELGEFIHSPIKNYSSGMKARLGFSIATRLDPDILIIDEILGVGDQRFRQKSTITMRNLILSGKTIILVTHNLAQLKKLCDRVIWIDKGEVKMDGKVEDVCKLYEEYMNIK